MAHVRRLWLHFWTTFWIIAPQHNLLNGGRKELPQKALNRDDTLSAAKHKVQ